MDVHIWRELAKCQQSPDLNIHLRLSEPDNSSRQPTGTGRGGPMGTITAPVL